MGTSVLPQVIDQLVARATAALPNLPVYDGFGISEDPGDYLMIGVDDPSSGTAASSAPTEQISGPMAPTRPRDETGSVNCAAYSWNGNRDQKQARDAAYATLAAVEGFLRTTPGLGIADGRLFVAELGSTQLSQNQNTQGADALLIFTVRYRARI